jgi:hypothetical protein
MLGKNWGWLKGEAFSRSRVPVPIFKTLFFYKADF